MPFTDPKGVPAATYRLQLRQEFPFAEAGKLVPYLRELGISHAYCSPILMSTPGSTHGYDVNDYRRIDPELGGREGFVEFARRLREHEMAVLLDFVPNHMGINGGRNAWWLDVLECGPHSPFAEFFDIDWHDHYQADRPRVLVPILDHHYGVVLEQGRFAIAYDGGEFSLRYENMQFPLSPGTYADILARAANAPDCTDDARARLRSIADAFRALPQGRVNEDQPIGRRQRDNLKRQLAAATEENPSVVQAIEAQLAAINGQPSDPRSLEQLDAIIGEQHYRLAHWKTGVHEVNYRRFFAIDSLIGLRMENPRVFEEAHRLVGTLVRENLVAGLRIDHIDGLRNPLEYLERVQTLALRDGTTATSPLYVVVEKILAEAEELDRAWPTHGTTGYEFIRDLARIFVDPAAEAKFTRLYAEVTGDRASFAEVVYTEKRLVLEETFGNAVTQLGHQLTNLLSADRRWRDVTRHELTIAVREIMAALRVYRIYRRMNAQCRDEDAHEIERACADALRHNPRRDAQPFEFVRDVLIGRYPPPSTTLEYREAFWRWVLTWQQYTGGVMAKSVEDTAYYVYNRFVALNEVGGDPAAFGGSIAEFHSSVARRRVTTPHTLLATSTHDTKLGEDVRARLYVLSEMPDTWADWVNEWRELNARHRTPVDGRLAPDANEEYRFYQTLLGCWPVDAPPPAKETGDTAPSSPVPDRGARAESGAAPRPASRQSETGATASVAPISFDPGEAFRARLREHIRKAINEAKRNTHWLHPSEPWIVACECFVNAVLMPETGAKFLASFRPKAERLAHLGLINSLAQIVLKITTPGVPDFYQGCEHWNLALVDPDNRQLIDWRGRGEFAAEAAAKPWRELLRAWRDGGIKLRLTRDLLRLRRERLPLFQHGNYEPVETMGRFASRLVAFRRRHGNETVIVVVPRLTATIACPPLGLVWEDTEIALPEARGPWRDVLTQREFPAEPRLHVAELFGELPLAVLLGERT